MCTEVARKSGKVYGYTKYREDLDLPNKDTFYCWPELFPISEDLNYLGDEDEENEESTYFHIWRIQHTTFTITTKQFNSKDVHIIK